MQDAATLWGHGKDGQVDFVCGAPPWCGSFKFYTTTAIACAQASTSSVPVLNNPAVPTVVGTVYAPLVVLRIMAVRIGLTVGSSMVIGNILYGIDSGAITFSGVTAGPAAINTFIGRGAATPGLWYTTATASAAPTKLFPSNCNAGGNVGSGNGVTFDMIDNINGGIVLPPGASFWPLIARGNPAPTFTALITVDVMQTLYNAGY